MNVDVEIDRQELGRFLAMLDGMGVRAMELREAFEGVAEDFYELQTRMFDTDGRPIGGWAPLADATLEIRQRLGRGNEILEYAGARGGRLRRSLTVAGASYQLRQETRDSLRIGTKLGIARIHQKGGTLPVTFGRRSRPVQVRIPARPLVQLQKQDRERWVGIARDHVLGTSKRRIVTGLI